VFVPDEAVKAFGSSCDKEKREKQLKFLFNNKITVSIGGVTSGPIKLMVLAGLLAKSLLGIAVLVPGGKFIVTSPRLNW